MFFVYFLRLLFTICCVKCIIVNCTRVSPQMYIQELDHLNDFLQDIQQEVRFSQFLINAIDFKKLDEFASKMNGSGFVPTTPKLCSTAYSDCLIRFFHLCTMKQSNDLMSVLQPAFDIAEAMKHVGTLKMLDGPVEKEFFGFLHMLTVESHIRIRDKLVELRDAMKNRRTYLSREVNDLIDTVDCMMEEGEEIYIQHYISEFELYPDINKDAETMCTELLTAFLMPFSSRPDSLEVKRLLYYANGIITAMQRPTTTTIRSLTKEFAHTRRANFNNSRRENLLKPDLRKEVIHADKTLKELQETASEIVDTIHHMSLDRIFNITTVMAPTFSTAATPQPFVAVAGPLLKRNYFIEAYLMFFEHIATANTTIVLQVLNHAPEVIRSMASNGQFSWIRGTIQATLENFVTLIAIGNHAEIRNMAWTLKDVMMKRKYRFNEEANQLLDEACTFISTEEGENLLEVMKEFKQYPNVSKPAELLCRDILDSFNWPFEKLKDTVEMKTFLRRVEVVLKANRPKRPRAYMESQRKQQSVQGNKKKPFVAKRKHIPNPRNKNGRFRT